MNHRFAVFGVLLCHAFVPPTPQRRRPQLSATVAVTPSFETLPGKLKTLVTGLQNLPDDKYRYKQLLFWASQGPTIDEALATPENKVPGCLSTVYVHATKENGVVTFVGDSDAQLTKGLVNLLVKGLSGSTPEEIVKVDPAFIKDAGITASLTPGRNNGFLNMLNVMKQKALEVPEMEEQRGPIATAILEKLALLQPISVDLVDESHLHAGHAQCRNQV